MNLIVGLSIKTSSLISPSTFTRAIARLKSENTVPCAVPISSEAAEQSKNLQCLGIQHLLPTPKQVQTGCIIVYITSIEFIATIAPTNKGIIIVFGLSSV